MHAYDAYGVCVAAEAVAYEDGAEDAVLSDLLSTVDRSDGSDELSIRIRDWPTRYHFSPLRTNLLRPLRIAPGMRVLDIGCGTGTITRWLAEQGANVVGVEGNVARARSAAVRCEGLPNVEIVAGTLESIDKTESFDLVVCIGVLEYSPVFLDPNDGPRRFLETIRSHLTDDGALILAIENQLGLKYLLGYSEDHRGAPWIGVEGYERGRGARTWSRASLREMLRSVGLPEQRWLFPFPDYKIPSVVVDERLYSHALGRDVIDHVIRTPVTGDASPPSLVCDARLAHRQFLDAGLGADIANSFLVVSSPERETCETLVGCELAWFYSSTRRRQWRRERAVVERAGALHIEDRSDAHQCRALDWLRQQVSIGESRAFVTGEPLDLLVLSSIRKADTTRLSTLLQRWHADLEAKAEPTGDLVPEAHPFAPLEPGELALPPEYLDVITANFVVQDDRLCFIDSEWVTPSPVSRNLVEVRALWWLAVTVVESGEHHPWGVLASVDQICASLCGLTGVQCPEAVLGRWRRSEAELQHLVHGGDRQGIHRDLERMGSRRTVDVSPRILPFTALRAEVEVAHHEAERLSSALAEVQRHADSQQRRADELQASASALETRAETLAAQVADLRSRARSAEAALNRAAAEVRDADGRRLAADSAADDLRLEVDRLKLELQQWENRFAAIERRLAVRLYRRLRRLLGG